MKIRLIVWSFLLFASFFVYKMAHADTVDKLIANTEPKVVKIGIVSNKGTGGCSGAIISEGGTILTCAHCFGQPNIKKVFIKTSEGVYFPAQLLKIDKEQDLAIIAPLHYQGKFKYFVLGSGVRKGQSVTSFGSPLGIQGLVTFGRVGLIRPDKRIVIHSAFLNPGNSGGPLVNDKGELVGINEAMLMMDFLRVAQGLYVAIDIQTIKEFIK